MEDKFILEVRGLTRRGTDKFILKDISFKIREGECWAITGNSGSGKSTLLKSVQQFKYYPETIVFGERKPHKVALIPHQHIFKNLSGINNFYYQQRFNSSGSEDAQTVMQEMLKYEGDKDSAFSILKLLRIEYLMDTPLIQLSNGEHKRYQIAEALFQKAEWLLLDDPFTGLDIRSRGMLEEVIRGILGQGIHVLIVNRGDVPSFITDVAVLDDGMLTGMFKRKDYIVSQQGRRHGSDFKFTLPEEWTTMSENDFEYAVRMKNVRVSYHGKNILSGIDWEVKRGDKWILSGPNGSGKSTLLSLVNGDNPQAFANDIYIFDRKRGTGETIWDIKRRIGYVSPELHQHFDKTSSLFDTVASGIFNTIGLFKKLTATQKQLVDDALAVFHLQKHAWEPLGSLSHGRQRWALLARALVKNPPLLILDEPCQGLDNELCDQFVSFIDSLCTESGRTLIYVTHVDEEIPDCITRKLKLDKGRIKEKTENGKEHHGDSGRRHRA